MATAARNIADGSSNTQKRSSDGCLTCRKRKVKCDENKPRCSACVRLDRTCSWDRQWKFRDLTALVTEEYHVISADEDLDQYAAATKIAVVNWRWCRVQSSKSYPRDVMRSCPPATTSDRDRDTKVVGSRGWSLPPEMNSVPSVRSQLLNTALFHYLPSDELNLAREDMKLWFTPENRLLSSPRSLALTAAIDAFSMAQAALTLREARFASSSVRRYIAGVAALRSALSYTRASTRDELIITMLIFQLIEFMSPTSQEGGWAVHTAGALRYVESLGPWKLRDQQQAAIYDQVRQNAVFWGIMNLKEIPFHRTEWVAMSQTASTVTSERQLIDLGTRIPGLLVATHGLFLDPDNTKDFLSIWQDLSVVLEDLLAWIEEYDLPSRLSVYPCNAIHFPAYYNYMGSEEKSLEQAFVFHRFHTAWFMSTAWVYLFTTQTAMLHVAQLTRAVGLDEHLDELRDALHTTIWQICQCVPNLVDRNSGFLGRLCIFMLSKPMTLYSEASQDPDLILWCQKISAFLHLHQGVAPLWMPEWENSLRPCLAETMRMTEETKGTRLRPDVL